MSNYVRFFREPLERIQLGLVVGLVWGTERRGLLNFSTENKSTHSDHVDDLIARIIAATNITSSTRNKITGHLDVWSSGCRFPFQLVEYALVTRNQVIYFSY